ncbi:MAG TPA: sulfurtransferase [Chloroflexota bacterium]|nr:sulfurtransferase [Chloroflexota bacterium]
MTGPAQPLVEADWVAAHGNDPDVRIIEVDVSPTAFSGGHIEGAVLWNAYTDLLQPNYKIVEREAFAALLRRSGIGAETRVVCYGYAASFGFWLLAYHGHQNVSLLNGSRVKWLSDGRPLSTDTASPQPTDYSLTGRPEVESIRATHRLVEEAIGDPERRLMDVRSVAEYTGERFWPSLPPEGDQRGGHVPGAVLAPIEDTWAPDGRFKPIEELRGLYQARGFTPDKEIFTYCAVGGRASQAWFVLTYLLGYARVRVYDGSWVEWGLLPGVPVEK